MRHVGNLDSEEAGAFFHDLFEAAAISPIPDNWRERVAVGADRKHSGTARENLTGIEKELPDALPSGTGAWSITPRRACDAPRLRVKARDMTITSGVQGYARLSEAEVLLRQGKKDPRRRKSSSICANIATNLAGSRFWVRSRWTPGRWSQAEGFLRQAIANGATAYEVRRNLASTILQQDRLGRSAGGVHPAGAAGRRPATHRDQGTNPRSAWPHRRSAQRA